MASPYMTSEVYYDFMDRIMPHTRVWFNETGSVLEEDNAQQLIKWMYARN